MPQDLPRRRIEINWQAVMVIVIAAVIIGAIFVYVLEALD